MRKARKGLIDESVVLDLWQVPDIHQQANLEHDFHGCKFRAFRVFRSFSLMNAPLQAIEDMLPAEGNRVAFDPPVGEVSR